MRIAYITRPINILRISLITATFSLLLAFSASSVYAATKADCNTRAEPQKCKQDVDNECGGMSGSEKDKCIDGVLSRYVITGLGAGGVQNCPVGTLSGNCVTNLPKVNDTPAQLKKIMSVIFGVAAGVALIVLLIAAFNYATAGTDIEKAARSKRSIITALMGLVIAVSAQAIVLTVLGQL